VRRLYWGLVGTLSAVAVILGVGGAWLVQGIVESTADRLLGASARAIAETLAVEDGEITLDIPPFALGMLENNARDNVYYSVRHAGRLMTGYADLPTVQGPLPLEVSSFRYADYRGARIRIASEARSLPRIPGLIVVEVAETLDARGDLAQRMWLGLAALELALVGVLAALIVPTVRWSLAPLTALRSEMDSRSTERVDFTPLTVAHAPVELAGVVMGFNGLLSRLEGAVEGMQRFTADASHQMRTPLAILRTHLALLRKHVTKSAAARRSLADVELAAIRLQNLLTGLIALARTEDLGHGDMLEEVDLRALAMAVVEQHAGLANAKDVTLRYEDAGSCFAVRTEPLLVAELLSNLVDNAIRYNRRGGSVRVRMLPGGNPAFEVEDDGPGVPEAERAKVFQRFYRLSRNPDDHGSGLGLSIVQALARRLNANVRLGDGDGGRGLQVTITLSGGVAS
jgi:two-component system sensor histidine kinase TctE